MNSQSKTRRWEIMNVFVTRKLAILEGDVTTKAFFTTLLITDMSIRL